MLAAKLAGTQAQRGAIEPAVQGQFASARHG
jgi:hypothetical protein